MDVHQAPFAVEMAFLLGALHAFEPGHGKTALFAYMADGRKSFWHSVFLGVTSGASHTLSILVFAFIAHLISHVATDGHQDSSALTVAFSWMSGILMLGIGGVLLWRARKPQIHACCNRHEPHAHSPTAGHKLMNRRGPDVTRLPRMSMPKTDSSLKVSALLGISGGLMPCPSALATYLSGMAGGKTSEALLSIVVFALGIAVSVSLLGVVFKLAGSRLTTLISGRARPKLWNYAQAVVILGVGLFYTGSAIAHLFNGS